MGKKQHQRDKLYLTASEWKEIKGYKSEFLAYFLFIIDFLGDEYARVQRETFQRLPFTHCALTFVPFKEPVCTPQGVIFDKKQVWSTLLNLI
jgi:peptidyl-prolyl cis-trans isomerase-like protein 2